MKIAICEDELIFARELEIQVCSFFRNKNIEPFVSFFSDDRIVQEMIENTDAFDLVFMDIHLSGASDGMEISWKLRKYAPHVPIIFITGLENRAIDGYDVGAFGFLIKQKYTEKLPLVLEKLWKQLYETETITITEKNEIHVVPIKEVLWIESDGRSSLVHTNDITYKDVRSIQNISAGLGDIDFMECFKSIFVNVEKIKSVSVDTITLINGHKLPVSRRSRKNVMLAVMKKVREQ